MRLVKRIKKLKLVGKIELCAAFNLHNDDVTSAVVPTKSAPPFTIHILSYSIEREVRKATRDLNNLLAGMGTPLERVDALQRRNTELFADMKRLEREHVKNKKRADQLQKEKDSGRNELSKTVILKDKLEKLCRELTRENKKMKVFS